ncbi:MAG: hypothetical protein GF308_02710 [Candidatus Heimdallarchaeota archaeon]|nr:hypothetical protein [Candidatus Heimdallarchaeota archaeon]
MTGLNSLLAPLLARLISDQMHIISYAFCPFIFGGMAIFAIYKWTKLEPEQIREMIWSILIIILAVLVIVFVGLNTFLWKSDLLFFLFIGLRFTLLLFLAVIANPYLVWAPLRQIFLSKGTLD